MQRFFQDEPIVLMQRRNPGPKGRACPALRESDLNGSAGK